MRSASLAHGLRALMAGPVESFDVGLLYQKWGASKSIEAAWRFFECNDAVMHMKASSASVRLI